MVKANRYFTENESGEKTVEKTADVVTYHANLNKKHKFKKNFKPSVTKASKTKKKSNAILKEALPVPEQVIKKYVKGGQTQQKKIEKKEQKIKFSKELAAKTEILLTEQAGCLEVDAGETSTQITQKQIADNVDITSQCKQFDLRLEFGPYRANYTRNGRHLVLGGKKGHVAAFDWVTKKLHCEFNVMEAVHDVCFLHLETMFAVAQKNWVYIYDNQGIELHCIRRMNKVSKMEFLPYHFLLATCSDEGYLSWLDISIGKLVTQFNSKLGRLSVMAQNPWNAVLCVGHSKGVVSMWSPNSRDPLAKMLCHGAPILGLHVDPKGRYMATSSSDRELKIWDIRQLNGPVHSYKLASCANTVAFSQTNMLALGMGNIVEVYKDYATGTKKSYMRNRYNFPIGNVVFCPFEDVLGVSTAKGFSSMLVPGSGEASFDGLELNPFISKSQRREHEVHALLEKIQPELISLEPSLVSEVNVPTLKEKIEERKKLLFVKPPQIDYEPRKKARGKGGSANIARNKRIVKEQARKEFVDTMRKTTFRKNNKKETKNILERF